ncbi:MAG TPA: SDR family NAD(P)-dependent oxidoreductase [Puia sp.]|nr:SDR family NAD(P)-dependent oxidoreductase [Puia sp.]
MKKIIIIGATSGIGRELARIYAEAGHMVGATGRRQELLYTLQLEYPNQILTQCFDVTAENNITHLESLIGKMGGLDLLIYNAGYGDPSEKLDWEIEQRTVNTNVKGFIEVINYAYSYFEKKGEGQMATTSSIASIRGNSLAPSYSASKAFQSVYFEGLHMKLKKIKSNIHVTDVQPGFVDTKMAKAQKRFWVSSPRKAAIQIADAIEKKKWRVYITRRWWIIAKILKWMPVFVYHRIG